MRKVKVITKQTVIRQPRSTVQQLREKVRDINHLMGKPATPYIQVGSIKKLRPGNIHLSQEGDKFLLEELVDDQGSINTQVFGIDWEKRQLPLRDMNQFVTGILKGLEASMTVVERRKQA